MEAGYSAYGSVPLHVSNCSRELRICPQSSPSGYSSSTAMLLRFSSSGGGSGCPSRLMCTAGSAHTCTENNDEKFKYIIYLLLFFLVFQLLSHGIGNVPGRCCHSLRKVGGFVADVCGREHVHRCPPVANYISFIIRSHFPFQLLFPLYLLRAWTFKF
jgi:hypothetical protein